MKQTAIVTGGSQGIGEAISVLLAKNDLNVIINYNKSEKNARAIEQRLLSSGYSACAVGADVTKTSDVKELFRFAYKKFGSLDILINNAGIAKQQLLTEVTDEDFNSIIQTNFGGVFKCCREAVPYMLKNHSGSIINISSMWGISGASCESVYSASKAAVIGFTKALAKELGPSGIRVNCIAPGLIDTKMNSNLSSADLEQLLDQTPLNRIGLPQDIAEAILFFAKEGSSFITGQTLSVDGGFII